MRRAPRKSRAGANAPRIPATRTRPAQKLRPARIGHAGTKEMRRPSTPAPRSREQPAAPWREQPPSPSDPAQALIGSISPAGRRPHCWKTSSPCRDDIPRLKAPCQARVLARRSRAATRTLILASLAGHPSSTPTYTSQGDKQHNACRNSNARSRLFKHCSQTFVIIFIHGILAEAIGSDEVQAQRLPALSQCTSRKSYFETGPHHFRVPVSIRDINAAQDDRCFADDPAVHHRNHFRGRRFSQPGPTHETNETTLARNLVQ